MSARREFLKKALCLGGAAGGAMATFRTASVGAFDRPYEQLMVEIRVSPSMRVRAREKSDAGKQLREMLADDCRQSALSAMENDDGTYPPII